MSFHINNTEERPKPKLWLARPDYTVIERLNGIENLNGKFNFMNQNEISFDINAYLHDEMKNEQYKNPAIDLTKNKYLIKFTYLNQEMWFVIDEKGEVSDDKDYVPVTGRYIGSELDKKYVGDIEEIGVYPEEIFNKFLPIVAPNWKLTYVDEKIKTIKRTYELTNASISSLIEAVTELTDSVVVFDKKLREFSLVHKDNAGQFKGLKVKEATYLKGFSDRSDSKDLVTRLILFGKDGLTINGVNPAGTSYIEDFSYYMKPFKRDSNRNVIQHSDYMSDELCHAILDFQEYFQNQRDGYEDVSESYSDLLNDHLEEDFKLQEIGAILQRLEDRIELLKPQGAYREYTIHSSRNLELDYNTHYMLMVQNKGSLAKVTFNNEEYMIQPNSFQYIKIKTPESVTPDQETLTKELKVLSSNANLVLALSTSSSEDFAEEDVLELDKKYNIHKYNELLIYQRGIVASIEKKLKDFENQRDSIQHSLSPDVFFPPHLKEERENFVNWGVWREENHTDAKELLEDGIKQLTEKNNVTRKIEAQLVDFLQSLAPEDRENWDKLTAGDIIRFSNKTFGAQMQAFISELNINFDEHDISLVLSDAVDFRDMSNGIAKTMANFASTASQVNMQKSQLSEQAGKTNEVMQLLEGEWDANKRRITAGNETVTIGNNGVRITSPTHPNEMLVAVAGVIAISNDNGQTFKQAINTRGVVAERLIGKMLIGTELVMENESGTFRFDNDGVKINASNFHLIADDGNNYFDSLLGKIAEDMVTVEDRIKDEMKNQRESFDQELSDMDSGLSEYAVELVNAVADGLLTEQEIHSLKLQMNMLEADYSQMRRRVLPIIQDSHVDPILQEEVYVSYLRFEEDYLKLVKFIEDLDAPTEISEEKKQEVIALIKEFKPALNELSSIVERALVNSEEAKIANAEYNANTYAQNLASDLSAEIKGLNEALGTLDENLDSAMSDGVISMIEKSQLSDALMRFESEKQDVDNRYSLTYNHDNLASTTERNILSSAKSAYNTSYNNLVAKVKQIIKLDSVGEAIMKDYEALYTDFSNKVTAYAEAYEKAVEKIQKGYADTAEGAAKKYADGLKSEVQADVKDVSDNLRDFSDDVYGAFKDGIITEQEKNRLGIHHDMLEKEKADLIERYNTVITSSDLQGFYDTQPLVAAREAYGETHASLLLAIETAMMDDKITKVESEQATSLFESYTINLKDFSRELELAITAIGEAKAVAHTNAELQNYMSLDVFNDEIAKMQAELDGHIITHYHNHTPTLSNIPASEWTTTKAREAHIGDLFYNGQDGFAYRFMKENSTFKWVQIKDSEVTKALKDAEDAMDLADAKRRVFVVQPSPPYDIGDLWITEAGELMRADTARATGSYSATDWVKATKYTDDTKANQAINQLNTYKTDNNKEVADLKGSLKSFQETVEGTFKDGIVADYELKILKTQMQSLDREKADVDSGYNRLLNNTRLSGQPKTDLQNAYTNFAETHGNLVAKINAVITDGKITDAEMDETNILLDAYPQALENYKQVMNDTYMHLIQQAEDIASGAKEMAERHDTWRSTSFETDVEGISSRVGSASWKSEWKPEVVTDIKNAVDDIEIGGRNYLPDSQKERTITSYAVMLPLGEDIHELSGTPAIVSFDAKHSVDSQPVIPHVYYRTSDGSNLGHSYGEGKETTTDYQRFAIPIDENKIPEDLREYATLTIRKNGNTDTIYVKNIKLEKGNKATSWTEAPEDTQARIDATNIELEELAGSLGSFEETVNNTFRNGIIEEAEAKAIKSHKAQLSKEKKDIDQKYSTVYNHSLLSGTAKTNLSAAKSAFNTAHSNLISYIDTAISNGRATEAEYDATISRFGTYEAKLATLTFRLEEANDYISSVKATSAETNAKSHAETKAQAAQDAAEKYAAAQAEAERIKAESYADGKVTTEEKARIADVNAKLKAAKEHADTTAQAAERAAKEHADTKIENIQVGGRNLLSNSEIIEHRNHNSHNILRPTKIGQYTISFDYEIIEENSTITDFLLYSHATGVGSFARVPLKTEGQDRTHLTFEVTENMLGSNIALYAGAAAAISRNNKMDFIEIMLERGNKPTDWSPAPEDIDAQFDTINNNALGLNGDLTDAFKDGIISNSEAKSIEDSLNTVKSDFENINQRYQNVYRNEKLSGSPKSDLYSAKVSFNSAYNSLVDYISSIITSGEVTDTQKSTYTSRYSTYRDKIGLLSDAIETAWDAITNQKVDDIEVGGRNLILNSTFNLEPYSYEKRYNILSRSYNELSYKNAVGINSGPMFEFSSPLEKGNYVISFDLEAEHETSYNYIYLRYGFKKNKRGGPGHLVSPQQIYAGKNNISISLDVTRDDLDGIWIGTNNSTEQTFVLKNLKLEKGNKATGWSPAPEDITNLIEQTRTSLDENAEAYAQAKAKAAENAAKAHADGVLSKEEEARIAADEANLKVLRQEQTSLENRVKAYSDGLITEEEKARIAADEAKLKEAIAAAELAETQAKAHADGKVTAEEKARIADATAKLKEAKEHANSKAEAAEKAAKEHADTEIGNIEVGGRNLLLNSEMEKGTSTYDAIPFDSSALSDYIGQEVTLSFYAKRRDSVKTKIDLYFRNSSSGVVGGASDRFELTDSYKRYTHTITITETLIKETNQVAIRSNRYVQEDDNDKRIMYKNPQVEIGNKATSWTPAPEDIQSQIDSTNKEVKDISDALGEFEGDVTGYIKDGIIEEAEAKAIKVHLQQIDKEKADLDEKYSEVYNNSKLEGIAKTNLLNAKTSYNSAHSNLKSYITTAISNDKVTSDEATAIESRFSSYSSALSTLSQRLEQAINAISSKYSSDAETSAKGHADGLKRQIDKTIGDIYDGAYGLNEDLTESFKDGIVSESEAKAIGDSLNTVKTEYSNLAKQYGSVYNNKKLSGTPKSNLASARAGFDTAYNSLIGYIDYIVSQKKVTDSMKSTYESRFYGYRTGAATLSEALEDALDAISTQKVDDVEVGGRNLIPYTDLPDKIGHWSSWHSSTNLSTSGIYPEYVWVNNASGASGEAVSALSKSVSIEILEGEEYTLSFKATDMRNMNEDMNYTYLINDIDGLPNYNIPTSLIKRKQIGLTSENTAIYLYQATFTAPITAHVKVLIGGRQTKSGGARFYFREPQLEKGNKATDWNPAPEDSKKQMAEIQGEVDDVVEALSDFESTVNNAFHDGVIEEAEAKAIKVHQQQLEKERADINQKYSTIYGNSKLTGSAKTNLANAKSAYNSAHKSLVDYIRAAISNDRVTSVEASNVASRFNTYESSLVTLTRRFEEANAFIAEQYASGEAEKVKEVLETTLKNDYSTTAQTNQLLGSYVTSNEYKGNLDQIATYSSTYDFKGNPVWLREANGTTFDDTFSYEIAAKTKGTNTSLLVAVLISKGTNNGWDLEILEEKGTTGFNPKLEIAGNIPVITTHEGTGNYRIDVVYTKYAGTFSPVQKAKSMIEQTAHSIDLTVKERVTGANVANTNLIKNTDFWNNLDRFADTHNVSNATTHGRISSPPIGKGWYRIVNQNSSLSYIWTRPSGGGNYFSVTEGQTYTFSILVTQNDTSSDFDYVYMRRNSDNRQIKVGNYRKDKMKIGEQWNRYVYKYTYTFSSPFSADDAFMFFGFDIESENRRGYYLSEWKLEEGNEATAYLEDYATKQDLISQINMDTSGVRISGDKISISAEDIALDGKTIDIGANTAIVALKESLRDVGNTVGDAKDIAEDARKGNNIVDSINSSGTTINIAGDKINLSGDVSMVNGQVKVRHLTATSGNNDLSLTASGMTMTNNSGRLDIGTNGIVYRDTNNSTRFQMDTTLVTSSAFGTSNANVYLAAQAGQEARVVDYRDIPGDGLVNSYRYLPLRAHGYFGDYLNANPSGPYNHMYIRPLSGGEVRITRSETTSTYQNLRADGLYGNHLTNNSAEGQSSHVYVRPLSDGEVRVTSSSSTTSYRDVRIRDLMANNIYTNTNVNLYLRTDNEVRVTAHGSGTNYRDVRGLFAYFDAFDANTGTHIYARPKSGGEFRVTRTGTTGTYEDIRFKSWYATSSEKYKTDITEWDYNVLNVIKDELKLYRYKFKSELNSEYERYHHGVIIERELPPEWVHGDGVDQYELSTWTLKGVQELALENDEIKAKNIELEKRLSILEQALLG